MQRISKLTLCVLILTSAGLSADELKPADPETKPTDEAGKNDPTDTSEWQPKILVTLQTSLGGSTEMRTLTRRMPIYETTYKEQVAIVGNERKTIRVPVRKLAYREEQFTVERPGTLRILCDELEVKMESKGGELRYSFESKGPMKLFRSNSTLKCSSGKYADGQFVLSDAEVEHAGTTMKATTMSFAIPVHGITTSGNVPTREPQRDWNPQPRPDGNFEGYEAAPQQFDNLDRTRDSDRDIFFDPEPATDSIRDRNPSRDRNRKSDFRRDDSRDFAVPKPKDDLRESGE